MAEACACLKSADIGLAWLMPPITTTLLATKLLATTIIAKITTLSQILPQPSPSLQCRQIT